MRFLYINRSFGARIGGGTHANELFRELRRCAGVEVERYPEVNRPTSSDEGETWKRGLLSRIASRVPVSIMLFYRLWVKPLEKTWQPLRQRIAGGDFDVLLIRPDLLLRLMGRLKQMSSGSLHVCAEVNALINEEIPTYLPCRRFFLRREVRLIDQADSIMVVSKYLKDRLIHHGIRAEKIMVNPNGVNLERFDWEDRSQRGGIRESWGVPDDVFLFGYAGGMESFRRLPEVMEQVGDYLRDDLDAWFVVVGDGNEMDEVRARFDALPEGVGSRVKLVGRVSYDLMPAVLSAFDCGLFPYSNPYGSPQKLFEYSAMGLPVVGPEVPAVTEVFRSPEHLLLVDQGGDGLKERLVQIRADPDEARMMGERSRQFVSADYGWSDNAQRLCAFLQRQG